MIQIRLPEGALIRDGAVAVGTLDRTLPGACARVKAIAGEGPVRGRLLEMGFVSGTVVRVVRLAPFGDPMQVELHGYHVSLRRSEARTILVEPA